MAKISFSKTNKIQKTNYDYPKFKLKQGETARIAVLEEPEVRYVHTLQEPVLLNGVPQTETKNRRDGSAYEEYKKKFKSRPLCLGDEAVLAERGSDPKHCPMCAAAQENSDITSAPVRRYAMHVVKYKMKNGSTNTLAEPYSVDIEVWSFTDRMLNILIDHQEEWAEDGGLKQHDLILGPCENETFQKFDVRVAPKALWLEDKEKKTYTVTALKGNRIEDISIACGSNKERQWIDRDLSDIQDAWKSIYNYQKLNSDTIDDEVRNDVSLKANLESVLDEVDEVATKKEAPKAESFEDLLNDDLDDEPVEEAPKAQKKEASQVEEDDDDDLSDFEDLLNDLED